MKIHYKLYTVLNNYSTQIAFLREDTNSSFYCFKVPKNVISFVRR